ncbi:MAG: translation initiation factor IF-2, partial [Clostridia bacterium]
SPRPAYTPRPYNADGSPRPYTPRNTADKLDKPDLIIKKPIFQAPKKKVFDHVEDKKAMNKKALMMRGFIEDETLIDDQGSRNFKKSRNKKSKEQIEEMQKIDHAIITTENLTVKILSETIGKPVTEIISKFMILGIMVNINSNIDYDSAELIASEFGITLEKKVNKTSEEKLSEIHEMNDEEKDLVKRPPVVTVMGHVDHGKTSLLDFFRKTNVIQGEAGGITQHIGAYSIIEKGEKITFIDTPGHAAFTAMRKRGANLTDIAILVVAADDGVKPQTVEAIKHIKSAKVPMIVAINKIDKPDANIDRIKQQLTENDVVPEEWGGDAILVPVSAKTGENMDKLLEMILFVAEYQNLRANPKREASGSVIEASLDKGKGTVATILVQNGTLRIGDNIVAGTSTGKVRAMFNEKGKNLKEAGPSTAVAVLGLTSVPSAGDEIYVVDEKLSKQLLQDRKGKEKDELIKTIDVSVETLFSKIKENDLKEYNVIIKADVQGSLEALNYELSQICNEEVKVNCIYGGVGAINENDVTLAQSAKAIIIGFNEKPDFKAKVLAEQYKIDVRFYKIIYEVMDFVKSKIDAMVTPKYKEVVIGHAEIRVLFKASKFGLIAGSYVLDGKISRGCSVRIMRGDKMIYEGTIATLQREKNDAKDVSAGYECGVTFKNFADIKELDTFEAYTLERIN